MGARVPVAVIRAVQEAFAKGDRVGVAKAMSPRLCDAIGVTGEESHVRARLRAYSVCVLNPLAPAQERQRATFEQLANVLDGIEFTANGVVCGTRE